MGLSVSFAYSIRYDTMRYDAKRCMHVRTCSIHSLARSFVQSASPIYPIKIHSCHTSHDKENENLFLLHPEQIFEELGFLVEEKCC